VTLDRASYAPAGSLEDPMVRTRTISYLLALAIGGGAALTSAAWMAGDQVAEAAKKKKKKTVAKKAKPQPTNVKVKVTAEQKKARQELMGPYKWGMKKDEVVAALSKQLDERYAELIAQTEDVYQQDKLRKEKAKEIKRVKKSWVAFEGQKSGWDVSIIDGEFKHGTDEGMIEYWENQGGKNQRRFFFFHRGELYRMFVQIDTTQFGDDQRSFEFFGSLMKSRYGSDTVDPKADYRAYAADQIFVKAVDKTRFYDAFCLVVLDPGRARDVDAVRKDRINDTKEPNKMLEAIVEKVDDGGPDIHSSSNKNAVKGAIDK
jgi:hypothetical protein